MNRRLFFLLITFLSFNHLRAQDSEETPEKFQASAEIVTRYMRTLNRGDLKDFAVMITYLKSEYTWQFNDWLKFGLQGNAIFNYGTNGIKPDGITGSGPIYEGNLWNRRLMRGSLELTLSQAYVGFTFGKHEITVGNFLRNTPMINAEPWPFPNAMQGLWYQYTSDKGNIFQFGSVFRISPRISADFFNIGNSLAQAGVGVDQTGNTAQYRGNVESDVILIAGAELQVTDNLRVDVWNFYVENVMNTLFVEPHITIGDGSWQARAMLIYQNRLNNGGNDVTQLAYTFDESGMYLGARVDKNWGNSNLELAFSRITDRGRLLLPREWGAEPFYTFQRRTRIEGNADVTAVMVKWQRNWDKERAKYRFFTSFVQNWMPDAFDAPRNKRRLPSHLHLSASFKYEPKGTLAGFSAELYTAYRFLDGPINGDLSALINRADFGHFDFILSYKL